MPRIRHPQHVIEQAVRRYLAGEKVPVLAKHYRISRPGFYLWVKKFKAAALERDSRFDMSPQAIESAEIYKRDVEIGALRLELSRVKKKLFEIMVKHSEI